MPSSLAHLAPHAGNARPPPSYNLTSDEMGRLKQAALKGRMRKIEMHNFPYVRPLQDYIRACNFLYYPRRTDIKEGPKISSSICKNKWSLHHLSSTAGLEIGSPFLLVFWLTVRCTVALSCL